MTKMLNLDELASPAVKIIRLKGYDHTAKELTVQEYIDRVSASKKVEQSEDPASNLERAVTLINDMFPTLVPELIKGLSLDKLKVMIDYALAAPEDLVEKIDNAGVSAEGNA